MSLFAFLLAACAPTPAAEVHEAPIEAAPPLKKGQAEAVFAAGCFWCVESAFDGRPGVVSAVSGYTGGTVDHPTYHQVGYGTTGHAEAVRVVFDPRKTSYEALLDIYWRNVDPFDDGGQFCDRGKQYRPAIFAVDPAQRAAAEASKVAVEARLGRPVVVPVVDAGTFWVAEAYHQDFHRTNPERYQSYRLGCGRDARLAEVWQGR